MSHIMTYKWLLFRLDTAKCMDKSLLTKCRDEVNVLTVCIEEGTGSPESS
jgi:hypothetical protein